MIIARPCPHAHDTPGVTVIYCCRRCSMAVHTHLEGCSALLAMTSCHRFGKWNSPCPYIQGHRLPHRIFPAGGRHRMRSCCLGVAKGDCQNTLHTSHKQQQAILLSSTAGDPSWMASGQHANTVASVPRIPGPCGRCRGASSGLLIRRTLHAVPGSDRRGPPRAPPGCSAS